MSGALHFRGARIVCPAAGERRGDLVVVDGVIVDEPAPAGATVIDCAGKLLAPAIIDIGAFAVDPVACRAGGIVRVAPMPDQSPVLDDPGIVQRAALIGKPDLWIHPIGGATKGLAGREMAEMAILASAGARAIGTGRNWVADSGLMHRILTYARDLDLVVIAEAQDGGLVGDAVATAGETATRHGLAAAPAIAEALAVARDLLLAEETGARIHLRIVTTAAALDLVRSAKRRGAHVTCGIDPAHLLLSDNAMSDFRTFAFLSPPLRCEADRQAALAALADGTIDVLCSAHDPRGPEGKRLPYADAEPGAAGAVTLLPLALGLARDNAIPLPALFDRLARRPATLLGLDSGSLLSGQPGDIVLIDENAPWQIKAETMPGIAGNTPFDGLPVQGRVLQVFKGGREVL